MGRYAVRVTRRISWEEVITVEIPDDADRPEALRLVDDAVDARDMRGPPDHADCEADWHWIREPEYAAPKPTAWPPPDHAWVQVGAHRWVTDGHVALREDCGAVHGRRSDGGGWLTSQPDIASLVEACPPIDEGWPEDWTTDPRMAPVMAAGDEVRRGYVGFSRVLVAWVLRGGEPIAIVAACRVD